MEFYQFFLLILSNSSFCLFRLRFNNSFFRYRSSSPSSPVYPSTLLSKRQVIPAEGAIKYCRTVVPLYFTWDRRTSSASLVYTNTLQYRSTPLAFVKIPNARSSCCLPRRLVVMSESNIREIWFPRGSQISRPPAPLVLHGAANPRTETEREFHSRIVISIDIYPFFLSIENHNFYEILPFDDLLSIGRSGHKMNLLYISW